MAMIIKNGLVRLNETAEHKILDYHLEHGFWYSIRIPS